MKNPAKTPKNIHSQDETARKRKLDGIPNRMAGYALKSKSNKRDGSPDTSKSDKEILKEVLEDKELKYLYTHGLKANACIKAIEKAIALTRKAERQRILEWAKKNRADVDLDYKVMYEEDGSFVLFEELKKEVLKE